VRGLWKEKERIDSFFDEEQEACYYRARNSVFPQDQKGSEKFRNRAGDKLWEVHQDVGLFAPEGGVFFDVCGGPGAWSEVGREAKKPSFKCSFNLFSKKKKKRLC